jgi:hypothetical protein
MKYTDFFLKLNVPNLPEMQKEVLDYLKKYPENDLSGTLDRETWVQIPLERFPIINSFVTSRSKNRIYETALRTVPPNFSTDIHVDGLREDPDYFYRSQMEKTVLAHPDKSYHDIDWRKIPPSSQYVLIIPIINYENSMNCWYDRSDDIGKEITHYYERKEFPYKFWINFYTAEDSIGRSGAEANPAAPVEKILIDKPTFIKLDIYHNVRNYGTATRIVLTMRIFEYETYPSLDQVFDYTGLV